MQKKLTFIQGGIIMKKFVFCVVLLIIFASAASAKPVGLKLSAAQFAKKYNQAVTKMDLSYKKEILISKGNPDYNKETKEHGIKWHIANGAVIYAIYMPDKQTIERLEYYAVKKQFKRGEPVAIIEGIIEGISPKRFKPYEISILAEELFTSSPNKLTIRTKFNVRYALINNNLDGYVYAIITNEKDPFDF